MFLRKNILVGLGAILLVLALNNSCQEELMPNAVPQSIYSDTGKVADVQGREYKTVKIGNQWWMAENLEVSVYCDSTPISLVTITTDWAKLTSGAYCQMDGNQNTYGYLYNWHAVNNKKGIAPEGWHVATDNDWKELEQFLGLEADQANNILWRGTDVGIKLKAILQPASTYAFYWTYYSFDVFPNNISGFSALPGGCRLPDGSWASPNMIRNDKDLAGNSVVFHTGCVGFWWTATQDTASIDQACYRYMDYKEGGVFRYYGSKNYGLSIRCVKDRE